MTSEEKSRKVSFVEFLATKLFIGIDPVKYANSLNTNVKSFCKRYMQLDMPSLYSLTDRTQLETIRERIVSHKAFVYSRRRHDDKIDGLDLYMDFLEKSSCNVSIRQHVRRASLEQEGRHIKREQEVYVRSASAREKCKQHYNYTCQICGIKMDDVYGELGLGFIEVHHLIPIHLFDDTHIINPLEDLITLCPNCHSMIHKLDDVSDWQYLKQLVQK